MSGSHTERKPVDGYEQFTDDTQDPAKLRSLGNLIQQMQEEEAEVERLERALKAAKERLYAVRDQAIPDAMEEVGIEEFTTTGQTWLQLLDRRGQEVPGYPVAGSSWAWGRDQAVCAGRFRQGRAGCG